MFVSTRCLFPDFVVTWLLGSDKTKGPVKRLFPQLTPEMLKEYNVGEEVENSISCFLLEAEGKKAIFDTGFNEKISTGIPDRLKELKISPDDINYDLFPKYLSTAGVPDPELMIRTSGESRISNFLLYQLAYSELYFTDVLWPDFTSEELYKALISYQNRERRFGKTSEQVKK